MGVAKLRRCEDRAGDALSDDSRLWAEPGEWWWCDGFAWQGHDGGCEYWMVRRRLSARAARVGAMRIEVIMVDVGEGGSVVKSWESAQWLERGTRSEGGREEGSGVTNRGNNDGEEWR